MIRYALACEHEHEFEAWFGASDDFDRQRDNGLLACPVCDSGVVRKQIMAPAVTAGSSPRERRSVVMDAFGAIRAHIEAHFDYVGDRFAAEARAIHAGDVDARGIFGEASPAEVRALAEDGVPIAPMPPAAPKKTEVN
ncbi:MAG TPA: DUF1178 family protein [Caulobacteraceae bacterium]|jgi:hypothetical protein